MDIALNFINQSNDQNNSQVVIFQSNAVSFSDESAIAWQVIDCPAKGGRHSILFSGNISINAADGYGNFCEQHAAKNGQKWGVSEAIFGHEIKPKGNASDLKSVEMQNDLAKGTIDACVYRGGKLLGRRSGIGPGQVASFVFQPAINVKLISQVNEGDIVNMSAPGVSANFSLEGITSADIVLSSGGSGSSALPLVFTLENIK